MCPILFHVGPFTLYSFGLMVATGFIAASYVLSLELKRKNLDVNMSSAITIICVIAGIAGSKLLSLIEDWQDTIQAPLERIFSPAGLTFYGGFILSTLAIIVYAYRKRIPFFILADAIAPTVLLAYGIARLGCHFAGDGDYGFPTTLPWGVNYENGIVPPSQAFRDFPEITSTFPGGIVPENIPCHPAPVYEFIICVSLFFLLWKFRKKITTSGVMFSLLLILAGLERFSVEFLRLNPRLFMGLSEAQLISVWLIGMGLGVFFGVRKKPGLN